MKLVCDFCHDENPRWEYTIPFGRITGHFRDGSGVIDGGQWLACDKCSELIEQRSMAELLERAMSGNPTTRFLVDTERARVQRRLAGLQVRHSVDAARGEKGVRRINMDCEIPWKCNRCRETGVIGISEEDMATRERRMFALITQSMEQHGMPNGLGCSIFTMRYNWPECWKSSLLQPEREETT